MNRKLIIWIFALMLIFPNYVYGEYDYNSDESYKNDDFYTNSEEPAKWDWGNRVDYSNEKFQNRLRTDEKARQAYLIPAKNSARSERPAVELA